jgi:hypothetical protein
MLSLNLLLPNGAAEAADEGFAPNAFIRIGGDGQIVLTMPYVEMGQGTFKGPLPRYRGKPSECRLMALERRSGQWERCQVIDIEQILTPQLIHWACRRLANGKRHLRARPAPTFNV